MKFIVPRQISTELRMNKFLSLSDLIFLIIYGLVIYMFEDMVFGLLQIPYYIFSGVIGFWLILNSFDNRGMKNYKSIYLSLIRFKGTYHRLNVKED